MADQLEGRNPVIECLVRKSRRVLRIWLDEGAKPDPRVKRILTMARNAEVRLERVNRRFLDEKAEGRVHNGVIALAEPLPQYTTAQLLDRTFATGRDPFFVLADGLSYEHNLGAILRSCMGFGVDGLIVPTRRGAPVGPVVQRVSMGAIESVPIVQEGLYSALKHIKRAGIPIVGADMGGTPVHKARLEGPLALVMGSEGAGLTDNLRKRCNRIVSVPLMGGLESLNVSVAASVLMYEKRRQDG
jgi:23S rRNA (guanosine2251-2'-O)-methyltransferase